MLKNLITATMLGIIITPQYHDITPNDGLMDNGSYSNPYVIKRGYETIGIIKPRYHDIAPNDGLMDSGTIYNPYEVELENGY